MDAADLMSLWKTDELPACDEGMVLALEFLTSCVEAVESGDSAEFNMRFNTLFNHQSRCDKCREI